MRKCTTYTLGKTRILQESDPYPDTDDLGKYGNVYQPGCIIRADRSFYEDHENDEDYEPPMLSREYAFFYPPDNGEKIGSDDYKKYALLDYQNSEDLNNGHWTFVILTVVTPIATDAGISDTIQNSVGNVADYFDQESRDNKREIIRDLISENIAKLEEMGFTKEEIEESTNNPVYPKDW